MFNKICEKIVLSGIDNGTIASEQKDEYLYGMNMLFNVAINIISMLFIGIITGKPIECIIFCVVYKALRKYTGGFHFESAWTCYISSCVMYFAVIGVITYIPFRICGMSIIVGISAVILWRFSPVEAINKPLDKKEKQVFKKKSRVNIVITIAVYVISLFINNGLAYVVGIGIIAVTFFLIIGKIKLILCKERKIKI